MFSEVRVSPRQVAWGYGLHSLSESGDALIGGFRAAGAHGALCVVRTAVRDTFVWKETDFTVSLLVSAGLLGVISSTAIRILAAGSF